MGSIARIKTRKSFSFEEPMNFIYAEYKIHLARQPNTTLVDYNAN
jgi:hypothetical protein